MIILTDSRRRITLPAAISPNQPLDLIEEEDGTYRLVPLTTIPKHQAWAWTPEMQQKIATALEDVREGRMIDSKSKEGRAFLKKLDRP